MGLFWTGIIIFGIGLVVRYIFKFKYYNDYKANAHTDLQRQELKTKYRPLIFVGLGIETLGCIIALVWILIS